MPFLKYSIYKSLINTKLTEEELEDLIKTIYVISLAYLKEKYNNKSDGMYIENMAIETTVSLLVRDSKGKIKFTNKILEYRNEINDEIDFNYMIMKITLNTVKRYIHEVENNSY